jgi:hypothetical protein
LILPHLLPRMKRALWSWFRSAAGLAFVLVLAAYAAIGLIVSVQHQERVSKIDTDASRMAAAAADSVAAGLAQFDRTLLTTIVQHQSLQAQNLDPRARNAAYFEALQREPFFAFIDIVDKNGLALAGRPKDTNNWSSRDYFAAQEHSRTDALFIGNRIEPDNPQTVGFTVSRRMMDGDGNFAGLVVMGIRLSYFRELIDHVQIGPNQSLMLLRDDCTILFRLPFDFNNVGNRFGAGSPFCTALSGADTLAVAPDPVDHIERQFAIHRVGTFPLVLSVGIETGGAFADRMALWWVVGGSGIAAVGLLLWKLRRPAQAATDRFAS